MPTIIKKGTNDSAFRLRNGKTITIRVGAGGGDHLNVINDSDFDALMAEYGTFIRERIISDKHPRGCFIIHDNRNMAAGYGAEIGTEIKDNSAPLEIKPKKKRK